MGEEAIDKLMQKLVELNSKVEQLVAEKNFDSKVPLGLREAAAACHVELNWLRERVARKEIPAYRNREGTPWNVFPADIKAFIMEESNMRQNIRQKSVLRLTRSGR